MIPPNGPEAGWLSRTLAELFAYCRQRLAQYKTPRYWTMLEEFPLTPSGKIQKFVLRERFAARGPDVAIRAEGPDIAAAAPPAS